MKKIIILLSVITLSSCLRLDDLIFVRDDSITEYLFDKFEGEVEIVIPEQYDIPDSLISLETFPSQMADEAGAKTLYGVYIGHLATIPSDTVILYCHGQKDHMDYYWTRAKLLSNCGQKNRFGVFMFDYRGYGLSEGLPTEDGMYADVKGALDWLLQRGCKHVVLYGFSLGSAPATYAAAFYKNDYPFYKLILESPFASADNLTQNSTVINTSASYLTDLKISNAEWIKDVDLPLMWMHGVDDDYIAISNGELIYANYNGPYKEAHRIEGAKHGKEGVPETMGYDTYLEVVLKYLEK